MSIITKMKPSEQASLCRHQRLRFTDDAGGLYLDCEDCPRQFVASTKGMMGLPDYHARSQFFTHYDQRIDPTAPPKLQLPTIPKKPTPPVRKHQPVPAPAPKKQEVVQASRPIVLKPKQKRLKKSSKKKSRSL